MRHAFVSPFASPRWSRPAAFAQKRATPRRSPTPTSARTRTGGAVDCYLDAVEHLYTMCRHVKSIEIIEFGYEKSDEGVNGAKSEYCVDKHKLSMTRPYQAALREATGSRSAVDRLRGLHELLAAGAARRSSGSPASPTTSTRRASRQPYETFKERPSPCATR